MNTKAAKNLSDAARRLLDQQAEVRRAGSNREWKRAKARARTATEGQWWKPRRLAKRRYQMEER